MSGTAPYEVHVTGTDDETFLFSIPFESADGTAFPFGGYAIEYVVAKHGHNILRLSQGSGLTVSPPNVVFKAARGSLHVGEYDHGCRLRSLETGDEFQVFDGSVTIGEGNF
ncbi:hypothetical protein [Microvirga alba]|uniref:Uncharacterized protein n=1 Tax=Microvirga alba TaxID=2791025 RepID=A0A931FQI8_9HYPH|nr:hypothetical protein [Microvirga alba]MBF9234682.1 hypothetical protein [Microvirga alba]